jgi:hypothetical protein
MKKFLLIAVATVAMSAVGAAATITQNCGTANSAVGGGGSDTVTCSSPAFTVALGQQITLVELIITTSFNQNVNAGNTGPDGTLQINALYNPTVGTPDTASCNITSTAAADTAFCGVVFTDAPAPGTNSYGPFNVGVTFTKIQDVGTLVYQGQAAGSVSVRYTYDAIPTVGDVPEPTTVALLGAGLVGIAAFSRRRRS